MTPHRIVCLSANPAIDRRIRCGSLILGEINRAISAEPMPGGKAAHVALTVKAMGAEALWLGFLGGATGDDFLANFRGLGIRLSPVWTSNPTRMNLELLEDSGRVTEVLEPGPSLPSSQLNEMMQLLKRKLLHRQQSIVVISGSLPRGVSPEFYKRLIVVAKDRGSRVILDTSGEALRKSISMGPLLVKPNREEAQKLLGRRLRSAKAIRDAARELIKRGAESAAISLGFEGLVWVERQDGPAWWARPPRVKTISAVGCGDATVAGFALAAAGGLKGLAALRLAAACGTANCLADLPGRIRPEQVKRLMKQIKIQEIC